MLSSQSMDTPTSTSPYIESSSQPVSIARHDSMNGMNGMNGMDGMNGIEDAADESEEQ